MLAGDAPPTAGPDSASLPARFVKTRRFQNWKTIGDSERHRDPRWRPESRRGSYWPTPTLILRVSRRSSVGWSLWHRWSATRPAHEGSSQRNCDCCDRVRVTLRRRRFPKPMACRRSPRRNCGPHFAAASRNSFEIARMTTSVTG